MINKKIISYLVCLFFTFQASALMAEQNNYRGKILKVNGDVEIVNAKGEKRLIKKADEPLNEMDTIVTKKGASSVVQFNDGVLSVLDEKSRLRVEKTSWFSYFGGKVYFTFNTIFGEPRYVKTRAATIGVRGTSFIISENEKQNGETVALKEGLLQIESTGPAFEIHKKEIIDEFTQFKQQRKQEKQAVQNEYEQYKQQTRQEFVEYSRQFTLRPDRMINLSGYRLDETAMSKVNRADFELFESEAEDLIKAFRSVSKD